MTFSTKLKELMDAKGIKAADLARASELSEAAISDYLKGKKEPRGKQSILIAKALDVSLDTLWETGFNNNLNDNYNEIPNDDKKLLKSYHNLDPHGKEVIDSLLNIETKRIKEEQSKKTNNLIDNELERMKDQQLINIPAVARRRDYSEPFELNLTKEQIERIQNAPSVTSDDDF